MNKKSTVAAERGRLRLEIKQLIAKYEGIKAKEEAYGVLGPRKQEEMFEIVNSIGMRFAKDGYLEQAEGWLKKAEVMTELFPKYKIVLHSNLACVYKKKFDFVKATQHLREAERYAMALKSQHGGSKYNRLLIDCWLNLCALLSSQSKHEQALETVRGALVLVRIGMDSEDQKFQEQYLVGKYNESAELEHLGKIEQAYTCVEEIKRFLNDRRIYGHYLEKKIQLAHQELRKKMIEEGKNRRRTLSLLPPADRIVSQYSTVKSSAKLLDVGARIDRNNHEVQSRLMQSTKKENAYCSIGYCSTKQNLLLRDFSEKRKGVQIQLNPPSARNIMTELTNKPINY